MSVVTTVKHDIGVISTLHSTTKNASSVSMALAQITSVTQFALGPLPPTVLENDVWGCAAWFLTRQMPFRHPTNSVKPS